MNAIKRLILVISVATACVAVSAQVYLLEPSTNFEQLESNRFVYEGGTLTLHLDFLPPQFLLYEEGFGMQIPAGYNDFSIGETIELSDALSGDKAAMAELWIHPSQTVGGYRNATLEYTYVTQGRNTTPYVTVVSGTPVENDWSDLALQRVKSDLTGFDGEEQPMISVEGQGVHEVDVQPTQERYNFAFIRSGYYYIGGAADGTDKCYIGANALNLKASGTYVYAPGSAAGTGTFGHYTAPESVYLMSVATTGDFDYDGVRLSPTGALGASVSGMWLHAGAVSRAGDQSTPAAFAITDATGVQSWSSATKYVPVNSSDKILTAPADGESTTIELRAATDDEDGLMHIVPGKYDLGMYFGHANPKLTITRSMNQTEAEVPVVGTDCPSAPIEYYSLQGLRLDGAVNGLVIRRQGTKSALIFVR